MLHLLLMGFWQTKQLSFFLAIAFNRKLSTLEKEILNIYRGFLFQRCQIVSHRIWLSLPHNLPEDEKKDLLQMAYTLVIHPENFLENFDAKFYQDVDFIHHLISWSDSKIKRLLLPQLRELSGDETLGRTNLGLVSRASHQRVKMVLTNLGYREPLKSPYWLAFQCFKEIKSNKKGGQSLETLMSQEEWQLIVNRYNQLSNSSPIDVETLKKYLEDIGSELRHLLKPKQVYLDSPVQGNRRITLSDSLVDESSSLNLEDDFFAEASGRLNQYISEILSNFNSEDEQLLRLYYSLQKTQQEIAQEFQKNQATISRRLRRIQREIIPSKILEWIQENLQIDSPVDYHEILEQTPIIIKNYYSST